MLTKSEIKKAILLALLRSGGQLAMPANELINQYGIEYAEVVEDLVRLGKLKSNYTTTQGISSALHYIQLTALGRLEADVVASETITSGFVASAQEALQAAVSNSSLKPVAVVFEDGSVARINSTSSEATIAIFKAAIKQASI